MELLSTVKMIMGYLYVAISWGEHEQHYWLGYLPSGTSLCCKLVVRLSLSLSHSILTMLSSLECTFKNIFLHNLTQVKLSVLYERIQITRLHFKRSTLQSHARSLSWVSAGAQGKGYVFTMCTYIHSQYQWIYPAWESFNCIFLYQWTPLLKATEKGRFENILGPLVRKGADINVKDKKGVNSLIMTACSWL